MEEKREQANPHDTFVKHFFNHPEVVADFLKHNLPHEVADQLDFSTLQERANEFLPNQYRNTRRADVVYSVKKRGSDKVDFLIHVEHQSTPDKDMVIRLLECWAALARKFSGKKIPIIVSFVLYHNSTEWKSPKNIADGFVDPQQLDIPLLTRDFLIDLINKPTQSLKEQGKASLVQMVLARQPSGMMIELLPDVKLHMRKLRSCCQEAAFAYMEPMDKRGGKLFVDELTKFIPDKSKKIKDMFERTKKQARLEGIQEGMQQGIQQGMQQGMQQGIQQGILTGMRELALEIVREGIVTEEKAKELIEKTKKHT